MSLLVQMLLFGVLGLGLECIFTGAWAFVAERKTNLMGYSSIWYIPLYALAPLFFSLAHAYIFPLPLLVRGILYVPLFFAVEYTAMFALRKLLGASPSEDSYYQSDWNINGLIRLDFAPAFFVLGLVLEFVFRALN